LIFRFTWSPFYAELPERWDIVKKANLWTQERNSFLTSAIQKMDEFTTIKNAETCWRLTCGNPILKFVDPEIIKRRAVEIRMLCMDEEVIDRVAIRCWICVSDANRTREAQREIEEHLSHYGFAKEATSARISVPVIEALKEDLEKKEQQLIWRRLLGAIEILGCGISRLDERVYQAWWDSVIRYREQVPWLLEMMERLLGVGFRSRRSSLWNGQQRRSAAWNHHKHGKH
jgi:hypothetical protein